MKQIIALLLLFSIGTGLHAQIKLAPKIDDAYIELGTMYWWDEYEPTNVPNNKNPNYYYLPIQVRGGYYLTRNVSVGLQYNYLRAGRSAFPDSVYHFAGGFVGLDIADKKRLGMLSVKFISAFGNYFTPQSRNINIDIDPYRTDNLIFYLGYELSISIRMRKQLYFMGALHWLTPTNAPMIDTYAAGGPTVGIKYFFPHKTL